MKRLLVTVLLFLGSRSSSAAVIHVTPQVTGILNADFTPADPEDIVSLGPFHAVLRPRAEKYVLQFEVLMRIEELQPGQGGFGNAAFNIHLDPNLSANVELPGWMPGTAVVDCGCGPIVFPWADNGDYGPSGTDLQSIILFWALIQETFEVTTFGAS